MIAKDTLTLIKWGGALVAPKNLSQGTIDLETLDQLISATVLFAQEGAPPIIASGAGNYGHVLAKSLFSKNSRDYRSEYALIRNAADRMRCDIVARFLKSYPYAIAISPSEGFVDDAGNLDWNIDKIRENVRSNLATFTHGDMIRSLQRPAPSGQIYGVGWEIYSGERVLEHIIAHLGKEYNRVKLVLVTDVDGAYTKDPKSNDDASLIPSLSPSTYSSFVAQTRIQSQNDVTGGMYHKVESMFNLSSTIHAETRGSTLCDIAIVGVHAYKEALFSSNLEEDIISNRIKGTFIRGYNLIQN